MRKLWYYFLALVLVGGAAAAIVIAAKSSKGHDDNTSTAATSSASNKKSSAVKKACNIFSLADAKQLLGDSAKGGDSAANISSDNFTVSTCIYTQDAGSNAPVSTKKSATLLVQAPKTQKGIISNQNEFGPLKPAQVQDVDGYGDKAYWDAEHGQLNILKNNTWYIVSYGPVTPADRSLDQAKQLADLLINKM